MKRIAIWMGSTATALVLLFSYHTSTSGAAGGREVTAAAPAGVVAPSPQPVAAATAPPTPAASPSAAVAASPAAPSPTPTTASVRTINGAAFDTRFGPGQVQIKVQGSRIVSADAIVYPTAERRDLEINSYAVPQLDNEAVQAQSASIDTVSGATYPSDGYRQSLQSAIDAAHL